MERRIKLTIAAISLGLLVAGGVRRWAQTNDLSAIGFPPSSAVSSSADAPPHQAQHAAAWSPDERDYVSPAAAQIPTTPPAYASAESARPAVAPAAYLPNFTEASAPTVASAASPSARDADVAPVAPQSTFPYAANSQPGPANGPAIPPNRYIVQPNDSFWTISQRVYGTGRYFQALYEYNRRVCPQPDRLPAGVMIETPAPYLLEQAFPDLFR